MAHSSAGSRLPDRISGTESTDSAGSERQLSLYLHYPFCVRKCRYCDFLSGPADETVCRRYLQAMEREIMSASAAWQSGSGGLPGDCPDCPADAPRVDTVFFGGGTPSLMTARELAHLLSVLHTVFDISPEAEITLECNPGTADPDKLRAFRECGINRLSIGVQSFHEDELRMLGRIHTAEQAAQCVRWARQAGFTNLSLDLISALPGQTYEQWMDNLKTAVSLEPEHISAYSLILEDGTPLKEAYEAHLLPPVPDEETDRRMYHDTKAFLASFGFHRYEISNYARPGFESRHNSGYWTEHPYLGFGAGASSYLILDDGRRVRWNNVRSLNRYLSAFTACSDGDALRCPAENSSGKQKTGGSAVPAEETVYDAPGRDGIREGVEWLSVPDQMAEFMFLGLRRMEGVGMEQFRERFGVPVDSVYGKVLRRYTDLGMLEQKDGFLRLTDAGIDVSNTIMADFLPD